MTELQDAIKEQRIQSIAQMILAAVAIGASLYWLRSVLVPFVLALFFVCGIVPVRDAIERRLNAPRALAVGITFLLGLVLGQFLWALMWMSVDSLLDNSDTYRERFDELLVKASNSSWVRVMTGLPEPPKDKNGNAPTNGGMAPEGVDGETEEPASDSNGTQKKDDSSEDPAKDKKSSDGSPPSNPSNKGDPPTEGQDLGTENKSKKDEDPNESEDKQGTADDKSTAESKDAKGQRDKSKDDKVTDAVAEKANDEKKKDAARSGIDLERASFPRRSRTAELMGPPPEITPSTDLKDYVGAQVKHWVAFTANSLMSIFSNGLMVAIFMFFMLLGRNDVRQPGIWVEIESKIRAYIVTKTAISLFTGAAFGFVLWMFNVPLALLFGFLAFLLNFIPNVGPVVASVLPLPLIILNPDLSPGGMFLAITLSFGVQFISGNILEPKIMGDSFELHPVAIMLALIFWGVLWGTVGMFLATPITAAIKILFEKFERTQILAHMLAGNMEPSQSENSA